MSKNKEVNLWTTVITANVHPKRKSNVWGIISNVVTVQVFLNRCNNWY